MSSTVADLEAQRLVARTPDPADRRGVLIELTETGADMIRESRRSRSALILEAAEQVLTADERAILAQTAELLEKLRTVVTPG
jgi:DNA-binding MarR family transcriptional regulator